MNVSAARKQESLPSQQLLELASHLKAEPHGRGFRSHCPALAHPDDEPSCDLDDGEKGVVLKCRSRGCTSEEIMEGLKAAGFDPARLFYDSLPTVRQAPSAKVERKVVAECDYSNREGDRWQNVRYEPKDFRLRHQGPDGHWVPSKGSKAAGLYQREVLLRAAETGQVACFTEGEKDVDNLTELGLVAVTSGSTGSWSPELAQDFDGLSEVWLFPDNDEAGRRFMNEVAASLDSVVPVVRIVELRELPDKGDVSDFVERLDSREKEEIRASIEAMALDSEPWSSRHQGEAPSVGISISLGEMLDNPELQGPPLAVVPRIAYKGEVTLLVAKPKAGKSTFLSAGIAAMSTGKAFLGEVCTAGRVLWVNLEESDRTNSRRLCHFGADRKLVDIIPRRRLREPQSRLESLKKEVALVEPAVVIVDSLTAWGKGMGLSQAPLKSDGILVRFSGDERLLVQFNLDELLEAGL